MRHARKKETPTWRKALRPAGVLLALFAGSAILTTQPWCSTYSETREQVSPERLRGHVERFSTHFAPRNYKRVWNLDKCAGYIADEFALAGGEVSEQVFEVRGKTYRNVIAFFGPETASRIVVGAHYDGCQDTPGADDNASGAAGLIELAHLLGRARLEQRVELVAFTLEEPPFFGTPDMGSARHAAKLRGEGVEVEAMICLEMIGYFSDEPGSQRFPSAMLKLLYPDKGNYIAIIGSLGDSGLVRKVKASMRGATGLPVHAMCAPKGFPGLDFSDHRNYWAHGYTAVMVTDTAFFRNLNYHQDSDTADTLDYDRMAKVVLGVYEAVVRLADGEG